MRLPWIVLVCALRFSFDRSAGEETTSELDAPSNSSTNERRDNKTTDETIHSPGRGLFDDKTEPNVERLDGERNETVVVDRRSLLDDNKKADANETEIKESSSNRENVTLVDSPSSRGLFDDGTEKNSTLDLVDESDEPIANSTAKRERVSGEENDKRKTGNAAEAAERRSLSSTIESPLSETDHNDDNSEAEITTGRKIADDTTGNSSSLEETSTTERTDVSRNEIMNDNEPGAVLRIMGDDEDERGNELKNSSFEKLSYPTKKFSRPLAKSKSTDDDDKNSSEQDDEEYGCGWCHRCCRCGCFGRNKKSDERKRLEKIVQPIKIDNADFDFPKAKNIRRTIQESDETSVTLPRRDTALPDWTSTTSARPISFEPATTEAPATTTLSAETAADLATSEIAVSARKKNRRKRPVRRREMSVTRVEKKCDRLRARMRKVSPYGEDEDDDAIDEQFTRSYFRGNFDDLEGPIVETMDNDEFGGAVTEIVGE